jgi:hypothetical protein
MIVLMMMRILEGIQDRDQEKIMDLIYQILHLEVDKQILIFGIPKLKVLELNLIISYAKNAN